MAAAPSHALALKSDGSLWVWGSNWLINDDPPQETLLLPQYRTSPAPIALGDWTQLASAPEHALGIRSDGSLWGWGNNYAGQVGDGTEIYRSAPQPIDANTDWRSVMANISMSFAIRTDGTLWAWGDDFDGVLGLGTGGGVHLSPEQVGTASNWKAVAPGKNHTIGVQDDGTLWAWGDNTWGQLGIPGAFYPNGPLQVGTDNNWAAVAATDNSSFALKTDGTLWAWGDNTLGHPHFSFAPSPGETVDAPQQVGTATNWATINANDDHIFGVRTDGTLWSWGDNTDGVLGTGAAGGVVAAPAQVGADNDWKLAAAGWTHGVAIKTDGSLWAWGDNTTGQLGDGTTTSVLTPERIGTQTSWSGVTAGLGYSFALTSGPAGAPGAPGAPTVVLGDRSADVQWQPADGNGSGISSYTITASPGGATATVDAAQLHAVMSNLTPGTVYTFTVRAANAVGESGESPASAPVTALGRPDPPMDVVATSGERQATVSWTAPADNNSPITGYTVTASPGGETAAVPGDAFSAVVAGLISGTSYTFTVVATNAIGPSSASAPSDPVTPTGAAGPQTISWLKQPPSSVTFGQSFPVAASASTGLPVTITTSGPCSYGAGIVTAVALGLCTVSADQEGNGNWLPAQLTASVTSALVSVTSSAKPGVPGQALTFTATAASTTTPTASLTGAMHLYDGTVLLGTRLVTAGVAKLTTTKLGVGSHSISAVFVARRVSPPVASPQTLVEIVPADTTIQLASSLNPSMFGRTIRFRAKILRVAPARGRITLGMVSFYDGNVLLGSVPIGRGATALVATSTLVRGTHQITAVFSGSPSDRPSSTAIALTQQIR